MQREEAIYKAHDEIQSLLFRLSKYWHCHQMGERSFTVRGRQIPLCARCVGILVGLLLSPLYLLCSHWLITLGMITAFLMDSVSQALKVRTSNNTIRLVTGMMFGFAAISVLIGTAALWL